MDVTDDMQAHDVQSAECTRESRAPGRPTALEFVLERIDLEALPALSTLTTKALCEAMLTGHVLLPREVRAQVVANDDPVGERFEPPRAAADQGATNGPAEFPLSLLVHEDRDLEIRPPQPPAILLTERPAVLPDHTR